MMAKSSKITHIVQSSMVQGDQKGGTGRANRELHLTFKTWPLAVRLPSVRETLEKNANHVAKFACCERLRNVTKWRLRAAV
jgi:hypothetical protein